MADVKLPYTPKIVVEYHIRTNDAVHVNTRPRPDEPDVRVDISDPQAYQIVEEYLARAGLPNLNTLVSAYKKQGVL